MKSEIPIFKQAQVTLFIIIGILIILALSLVGYFVSQYVLNPIVPVDESIQDYVQSCLKQSTIDALNALGERGGYLDYSNRELSGRTFSKSDTPAEGDILEILPSIPQSSAPYWWHMSTPNDCSVCELSKTVPSLTLLEKQTELFIEENLFLCIKEFGSFQEQGYTVSSQKAEADVTITETDVHVTLLWPLRILDARDRISELDRFETDVDIPLKKLVKFASELVEKEKQEQYLEYSLLHLISSFSGLDASKLPPVSSVTHDSTTVVWAPEIVEESLEEVFALYIPLIRIKGTQNDQTISANTPEEQGAYDGLRIEAFEDGSSLAPFEVDFTYLEWPFYFDISTQQNGLLTPEVDSTHFTFDVAPPFRTNYYEFFYDLSVPVLMSVTDTSALKGEGYSFFVPLEINIRDNKNMQEWHRGEGTLGVWNLSRVTSQTSIPQTIAGSCSCLVNETIRSQNQSDCYMAERIECSSNSLHYNNMSSCLSECYTLSDAIVEEVNESQLSFCDPLFAQSKEVTIKVSDAQSKDVVRNAALSFGCGDFASCPLQLTDRRGITKTRLPYCFNGFLNVQSDEYHSEVTLLTPSLDESQTIEVSLFKKKPVDVSIRTLQVMVNESSLQGETNINASRICCNESALKPSEKVLLSFRRQTSQPFDVPFTQLVSYSQREPARVELIAGVYDVDAQLVDTAGIPLAPYCKRVEGPLGIPVFLPQEQMTVTPARVGGIQWNNATGQLTISSEELTNMSAIHVSVFRTPTPTCISANGCVLPHCVGIEESARIIEYMMAFGREAAIKTS